jgi:hypothetical protein
MRSARSTTDWRPVMDEACARMLTSLNRPGGAVAQLGARLDGIEEVVGSNPIGSTKDTNYACRLYVRQSPSTNRYCTIHKTTCQEFYLIH